MKFLYYTLIFFIPFHLIYADSLGEQAYKYTKELLSYGPRVIDTQKHREVQNFIKDTLIQNSWKITTNDGIVNTALGKKNIHNIIAYQNTKGKAVVFLAHYDSKILNGFQFLGADDSASAVGLLLSLAHQLKNLKNIHVELVFLDGEEALQEWSKDDSLYGSKQLSNLWDKLGRQKNIYSMILLDMIGGENTSFCREYNSNHTITNKIWEIAQVNYQDIFKMDCISSIADDHIPFIEKKFPIIDIISYPFPNYWHTADDTIKNISSKKLDIVGDVLLQYIKLIDQEFSKK